MSDTGIMIVEDERIVALDLKRRLQGMGYAVKALASTGHEAVEKAGALRPDLILMDIHLANGMDGIDAAEQVRQLYHIPVIFLTAFADDNTLARAKITEPFGYILKPFEERELLTNIEMALYRSRVDLALRESEARYRDLFENANDLIQSVGPDGHFVYVNRSWKEKLGYTDEEIANLTFLDIVHPDSRNHCLDLFSRIIMGERIERMEAELITKGGRKICIEGSSSSKYIDGKPVATRGIFRDVTERNKAAQALHESEEKFRRAFFDSAVGMALVGMDMRFLQANPALCSLLGYSEPELVTKTFQELTYPEDLKSGGELFQKMCQGELEHGRLEKRYVCQDGHIVWVNVDTTLIRDSAGTPLHFVTQVHDITARHEAEEALRQQNAYLGALHNTSLGLIRRLKLEDLLKDILAHAGELVGTEHGYVFLGPPGADEIEMRVGIGTYANLVGTRTKPGIGLAGTIWQTGEPIAVDDYRIWEGRLPDPRRDVLRAVVGVPLKSGPQTVGVIGLAYLEEGSRFGEHELTALNRFAELASVALDNAALFKKTQDALAELENAETFLEQVVDNLPNMIFVKDAAELRFVSVNRAGEALFGVPREKLLNKNDYDFFPKAEADFFVAKDRETLASGLLVDISEESFSSPHLGERILHTKKIPIFDGTGKPRYLLGISEDITERKHADEQRLALERRLQESQKLESLGVLAGGIAHDFNNLLVSILGNVGLVLLDLEPTSPVREPIEQIKIAAQRAADLTKQMLAYSGKGRFVMQAIDINHIIQEMTQLLKVSISKNATLKLNLSEELPVIEADATQIRQIVMNLITNASDAIGAKQGVITLSTGLVMADRTYLSEMFMSPAIKEGRYVYLEVADTGCGMDAETKARIFDPFFTTKFTGRGLGLAAVLGILRGHGGAIKVYSELGQGTVFRILLPTKEPHAPSPGETGALSLGKGTVLVIDDEEVVRTVTRRILERFGYTPLIAEDGATGAQLLRAHRQEIVCVLLDMTMPQMSGEETLLELTKVDPQVKVVLMSGYTETEANRRFKGNKLAGFMQKPYTPEELREKLHCVLSD